MKKHVLVTGCAGFIGSHLAEKLLLESYNVIGIDNLDNFYEESIKRNNLEQCLENKNFQFFNLDITKEDDWAFLDQFELIGVFHLAAKAGVLPSIEKPIDYFQNNIFGTQLVLEYLKKRNIKKLVFASSSSVYGNNSKTPFSELDDVNNPISPYALSKKTNELQIFTWHHLYKIDAVCLRFFTVYGPRQRPDLAIRKFVTKIQNNEPIEMYGDGTTARDYTYIADTIDGIFKAWDYVINNESVYEIINLGNKSPISLKHLIFSIYKLLNKEPNVIACPMKPGDVNITFADIEKAENLLLYKPNTSLEDGLTSFINWKNQSTKNETSSHNI